MNKKILTLSSVCVLALIACGARVSVDPTCAEGGASPAPPSCAPETCDDHDPCTIDTCNDDVCSNNHVPGCGASCTDLGGVNGITDVTGACCTACLGEDGACVETCPLGLACVEHMCSADLYTWCADTEHYGACYCFDDPAHVAACAQLGMIPLCCADTCDPRNVFTDAQIADLVQSPPKSKWCALDPLP